VSVELETEMRARIRSELRRSLGGADGTHITPEAAAAAGAAAPAFNCKCALQVCYLCSICLRSIRQYCRCYLCKTDAAASLVLCCDCLASSLHSFRTVAHDS
jgi:hypothetical protein